MGNYSLAAKFTANAAEFNRVVSSMETRMSKFTRGLQSSLGKANTMASKVHETLKGAAMAAVPVALGAGLIGKNVIETGANFEAALSNVAAVSGATGAELDKLKAKALELGSTTKFTGTEVVGAMEGMVKAGFKVDETLAGVGGILSAAAADGGEVAEISESIMASMKGLGMGPEKMQIFADMLAKAGDTTKASIGTLTESMAKFGPVARQLDIPVESAIAQLALLQDAGLDAATAGTSLASVYSKLAAPMGATEKALKRLGISVKDATTGNMKKPAELMGEIIRATDGIEGNVGKMEAITQLVGLESQKALLNVAAAAKEGKLGKLTADLKALETATVSYADVISTKKLDNFSGDMTKLGAAVDTLKVKLFDTQKGPLRGMAQGMTEWVKANQGLIISKVVEYAEAFRQNLPEIVTWIKRIGVAVGVFYTLAAAVKVATLVTTAFNIATKVAAFTMKLLSGRKAVDTTVTLANTTATGASTVATWLKNAALGVHNFLTGAGTKAMGLFRGAQTLATTATARGALAIKGATLSMGAFAAVAGAATAAIGAWMLAWDQADKLKNETGGLGWTGTLEEMWDRGTWSPFEAVDAHMDEQAKAKAAARAKNKNKPKDPASEMGTDVSKLGLDPQSLEGLASLEKQLAEFNTEGAASMLLDEPEWRGVPFKPEPNVVTPAERASVVSEETIKNLVEVTRSELIIKDETGRGELRHKKGNGKGLRLQQSGAP